MDNKFDRLSFLAYINNPLSREGLDILYSSNNIKYEKCLLYGDFVVSLLMLAFDTYMGDDVTNQDEQIKHFDWCWNKNIDNFKSEEIYFENSLLYDYFLQFMLEVFYSINDKKEYEKISSGLLSLWIDIFSFTKTKTNSDVDTLVEIYNIFEKSLKKV
jgi:hypothetical protein